MAIFNSYVKLPEGILGDSNYLDFKNYWYDEISD